MLKTYTDGKANEIQQQNGIKICDPTVSIDLIHVIVNNIFMYKGRDSGQY